MRKIPTLFIRDPDHAITDVVTPGTEWVTAGEGTAYRKWDGTCCLLRQETTGLRFYKRYDAKHGKLPPNDFIPAQRAPDPITGHWPGWVLVKTEDRWHFEAANRHLDFSRDPFREGTYELCGPRINKNPEALAFHYLIRHDSFPYDAAPRTYAALKEYFTFHDIEGIVWHHPDGRMVKIKGRDFGISRELNGRE